MAWSNPLRKLVQLVLDRSAASKMEADAKRSLGAVDSAMAGLERTAKRIAGIIAAGLGLRALFNLAKSSVREAAAAEAVWSDLEGTVDNAGASFKALEKDIRAVGDAFQDATIHSDEEFATSLSELITLTGNVGASMNNMGLVANVAAKFFRGDLAAATGLVAKVMNGILTPLQRMGIHAKSAQEGLDILAKRSFGAAEKAASTFSGQMKQVNNLWGEFKEQLGTAVTSSGDAVTGVTLLRNALKDMITWVVQNRAAIQEWVKVGVNGAITAIRTLLGVMQDFARLKGLMSFTTGTQPFTPAGTKQGIEAQLSALDRQRAQAVREQAAALRELEKFQRGFLGTGFVLLGQANPRLLKLNTDLQVANDLLQQIDDNAAAAKRALSSLGSTAPGVLDFNAPGQTSGAGAGGRFAGHPDLKFRPSRTEQDIEPHATAISTRLPAATSALQAFGDQEAAALTMSNLLGQEFDALGAEAANVTSLLNALAESGMQENDPLMVAYLGRLREIQEQMRLTQQEAQLMADIAGLAGEVVGASLDGGLGPFARMKAKVNLIRAAEETAEGIAALASLFGAVKAGAHFAAAGKFVAIAGAWAAVGGGVGGGGPGGGGSSGLSGARGASSGASRDAKVSQDVSIFLVGPGFSALNPEVQKVVYGAEQMARERFGKNAKIRVTRRP